MRAEDSASDSAWYRHAWPWFIVILLAVSVLGSLATVVIAFRHQDIDVRRVHSIDEASPAFESDRADSSQKARG